MSNKLNTDKTLTKFKAMKADILRRIANNTVNYFQDEVFDTQGAAIGSRWKQSERAKKDGGKTLQKTGKGKRSISAKISGNRARIAPRVKYMRYHQEGAGNNPLRKFMGNSKALLDRNSKVIVKELRKL
jgi:phage gpG-like protein